MSDLKNFQKIKIGDAKSFSKKLGLNNYISNPYWLAFNGFYENKDGEILIYDRDVLYKNDFPYIGLPKNKKLWERAIIINAKEEDILNIKKEGVSVRESFCFGTEYFYKTSQFAELEDPKFRKIVNRFKRKYKFKIKQNYSNKKIMDFLVRWEGQQKTKNVIFENGKEFENFCIKNYKEIGGERLFIEIDGELVGYCLFIKNSNDYWVGIHKKVDYRFEGLSRFLLHQECLMFKNIPYFTLGSEAQDMGIKNHKLSLRPFAEDKLYYVITDGK